LSVAALRPDISVWVRQAVDGGMPFDIVEDELSGLCADEDELIECVDLAADLWREKASTNGAGPHEEFSPWKPTSITEAAADPPRRPDKLSGILYSDAETLVSGEPGVGKSMFLTAAVADEAIEGGTPLYSTSRARPERSPSDCKPPASPTSSSIGCSTCARRSWRSPRRSRRWCTPSAQC
jgi:hypothetical protein